jgi:hypothetical protein
MKKTLLTTLAVLGMTSVTAQASITINGTHDTALPNKIETYFFKANTSGASDIFLSSQQAKPSAVEGVEGLSMNGLISVWQQVGSNWQLVGANDDAARQASNSVNVYGVNVHDWQAADPTGGISDPGLNLELTAGATYLLIQSDQSNGPKSLAKIPLPLTEDDLAGPLGQTIAIGSPLEAALWGSNESWLEPTSGAWLNDYVINISGDITREQGPAPVTGVPVPAAVWLFGSALAGFGVVRRKKAA